MGRLHIYSDIPLTTTLRECSAPSRALHFCVGLDLLSTALHSCGAFSLASGKARHASLSTMLVGSLFSRLHVSQKENKVRFGGILPVTFFDGVSGLRMLTANPGDGKHFATWTARLSFFCFRLGIPTLWCELGDPVATYFFRFAAPAFAVKGGGTCLFRVASPERRRNHHQEGVGNYQEKTIPPKGWFRAPVSPLFAL